MISLDIRNSRVARRVPIHNMQCFINSKQRHGRFNVYLIRILRSIYKWKTNEKIGETEEKRNVKQKRSRYHGRVWKENEIDMRVNTSV